jgi:hypothetical protein
MGGKAGVDAAERLYGRLRSDRGRHELGLGQQGLGTSVAIGVVSGLRAIPDVQPAVRRSPWRSAITLRTECVSELCGRVPSVSAMSSAV